MKLICVSSFVLGLLFSNIFVTALEQKVKSKVEAAEQTHTESNNVSSNVDCAMEIDDSIIKRIKIITIETFGVEETDVTLTSRWVEDLGADSLDVVELIMAMEDEFNIEIPDADAEKLITVQDATSYIKQRLCNPTIRK